jgi:hypothetical protein
MRQTLERDEKAEKATGVSEVTLEPYFDRSPTTNGG